ncbi:MAG: GerMN domain-containing protein [Lachnospiraceae bacterium]|nr:GerMN domain-containing protein [Lachnospiraceae bacterium]
MKKIWEKKAGTAIFLCVLSVSVIFLLSACGRKKETTYKGMYVYCVNTSETQVVGEKYKLKSKNTEKQIDEFLKKLSQEPADISLKKAIPTDLELKEHTISEAGDLCLYWTTSYANYTGVSEVLRRAAIVKTLCQIEKVHTVEFYVAGQPLTDANMNVVGFMTADTFIDNTGEQAYRQKITLNIYFSNETGDRLKKVPITISYDASIPIEQLVTEQLVKGPEEIKGLTEKNIKRTISSDTKINKISVRENTCYLDLSGDFLNKPENVTNETAIYSVVNTLTNLSNINRVQFSIDGEQNILFNDQISFGKPFETNLDLVEY